MTWLLEFPQCQTLTENEYTRPRLLVIPTTGTDTETDMERLGLEKNLSY